LFLLVIFMLLGSLLYTPGVLIRFADIPGASGQTITITGQNKVVFNGKTNDAAGLEQWRGGELKNAPASGPFQLQVESGADPKLVQQVRDLFRIQLPEGDNLTSTDNPTIVVAVNFRGQYFFQNQPIEDKQLKTELRRCLEDASRASKKLTMVLWADKAAENDVVMHLYGLARSVGITDFLLAERPSVFAKPTLRSPP